MESKSDTKISLMPKIEDFVLIENLSAGAYGKVVLAHHRLKTDQLYAVKIMDKKHMLNKNMADRVNNEKNALAVSHSDLVVKIFYALESRTKIYLVMEYIEGGDLKALLQRFCVFPEIMARFYIAECALALEYLHRHDIIHRDIKPDNILVGRDGHIKLTDFGLCNFNSDKVRIADVIATPLNPGSRKLPARTPGQVISLTTNLHLTPTSVNLQADCNEDSFANTESFLECNTVTNSRTTGRASLKRIHESSLLDINEDTSREGSSESLRSGLSVKRIFGETEFNSDRRTARRPGKRLSFKLTTPNHESLWPGGSKISGTSSVEPNPSRASTPYEIPSNESLKEEDEDDLMFFPLPSSPTDVVTDENRSFGSGVPKVQRTPAEGNRVQVSSTKRIHRSTDDCPSKRTSRATTPENNSSSSYRQLLLAARACTDVRRRNVHRHNNSSSSSSAITQTKQNVRSRTGIVGTPEYLAPEVIRRETHTTAVDVWSLGVCLYEFLVGCSPFIDASVAEIFSNILCRDIEYPDEDGFALSSSAVNTIESLLDPDVSSRPTANSLRNLPLFAHLDFENIHKQRPPWIPDLQRSGYSDHNADN